MYNTPATCAGIAEAGEGTRRKPHMSVRVLKDFFIAGHAWEPGIGAGEEASGNFGIARRGGSFQHPAMSKYAGEEVLVVERGLLEGLGMFEGLKADGVDETVEALLKEGNHFFMDRMAAEEDPSHKQLIPYCIFKCGDRVLHYTRGKAGGENRLHAKLSVGVGGHINPVDMGEGRKGAAAYYAAVQRELDEELEIACDYEMSIIGLLNDDSNPVGQVHLGVVHLVELESEEVSSKEDALTDLSWATVAELNGPLYERLETWSQLCAGWLGK